jgi:serine/threonine protein kinase
VDSQPDPDIQIAGYRIEARLGSGGMGEVYRAVQLSLDRRVALKVLAPKLAADDVFRRRFLRESRIAASIDHPSIIPIYETGEDRGLLYIAMRYVDGMDLATLLRRDGRLAPARALAIMTQVASALDAAHARGLVHRDVKPGNILLAAAPAGGDGHCYLCDFGLIKQVDPQLAQSALTATDQFVGTIPYVAPEQIEGRALDGRADVYALGCVMFQCLTGSVPFERMNDIEVVFAHMREPPPAVSDRVPGLPPAVDAILARAMAKSRDDRWPTCSALVSALAAELRHTPARSPTPSADADTRSMLMPPAAKPRAAPPRGASPAASPGVVSPAAPPGVAPPAMPPAAMPPAAMAPGAAGAAADPRTEPIARRPGPPPPPPPAPPPTTPETEALVHREGGDRRPGRRGRRWLLAAAAVVLPVGAYLGTLQLLSEDEPRVVAAPGPTVTTTRAPDPPTCPSRVTRPEVGDPNRTPPLAAIRAHMGWSDQFLVDEIRTWRSSGGQRRWYVKARQQGDQSRRGRWLVERAGDGQPVVLATAPFGTRGYAAKDWEVADGQQAPTRVAGCLTGT